LVTYNKIIVGILTLLLSASIVYIYISGVKIRVDNDKTTYYVKENNRWVIAGQEYLKLFDGTTQMNRNLSSIKINTVIDDVSKTVVITKSTGYIRGPNIVDTYYFQGMLDDPTLFPIKHIVEVYNAKNKFLRYEIRDLTYDGLTYKLAGETELYFGKNMKLKLSPDYRWAWVYKTGIVKAQYDIPSDYEIYEFRFYDPTIILYLNGSSVDRFYEYDKGINITGTADTGSVCLSIDAKGYGDNYTCRSGSIQVNLSAFANQF